MPGTAVVFGARNLGGAFIDHLLARDWRVAGVARSHKTAEAVRRRGALGIAADALDADEVRDALERVGEELGVPELLVNAVGAAQPATGGPFGGGPFAEATVQDFEDWTVAVAQQAFVFLSEGARALRDGGTMIQVTGGSARRAMPGKGLWAAGAQATRAMVHAAAQELRESEIHVALLIVDATIHSPKTADLLRERPIGETADQELIAEAVEYLAGQQPRAWTHELVLTPSGERWVP
jgi:NAD(P)-dependent dehydrogenase (short-subunit alcohol dehydrogenase family)